MEQERGSESSTTALRERLLHLELANRYERQAIYRELEDLQHQLNYLRQEVHSTSIVTPLGLASWVKLGLAVLLPFLVLLATGSFDKARTVSGLLGP